MDEYQRFCDERKIPFEIITDVSSYDSSTMFCPAGMQKYKSVFKNTEITGKTISNVQSCIRLNDLDLVGDGTHSCCFSMMGLFSFREWSVQQTVDFWLEFLSSRLNLTPTYVTIHPDKSDWNVLYKNVPVKTDIECVWSDGDIGGYCTEFYIDDVEIGNIVNPLSSCIDVGFGLERLDRIVNKRLPKSRLCEFIECSTKIISTGVRPSNKQHGYVLRKLLGEVIKLGGTIDHPFFIEESVRHRKMKEKFFKERHKHADKNKEWWYSTYGVDIDILNV